MIVFFLCRHEVVVKCLPWSDYEIKTDGQTSLIRDKLVKLNRKGILTIKSQPNACAVPSDDKVISMKIKYDIGCNKKGFPKPVKLNRKGILTIKSQPNACTVPSDDKLISMKI